MSSRMAHVSAETGLILACCRPVAAPERLLAIRDAGARAFDPATLLAYARAHRVEGFVQQGLAAAGIVLPEAEAVLLDDRVRRARLQMLRNAAEEVRVTGAFHAAGIDVVSLKGASLAMLAHGTLALKTAWDIDLLVRPRERAAADAVLAAIGYDRQVFDGRRSAREIERYATCVKEMVWRHPERDTAVELHRALFSERGKLATIGMDAARATVPLPGAGTVQTLAAGPLFAYLAVHGGQHSWIRLKWLADFAGLIRAHEGAVEGWYRDATAAGAGRAPAAALLLSHRLLGTALPTGVAGEIMGDRQSRRFVTAARWLIDGSRFDEAAVPLPTPAQRLVRMMLPHRLWSGPGERWRALTEPLRRPHSPSHLKMPTALLPPVVFAWLACRFFTREWRRLSDAAGRWRAGRSARPPRTR